MTGTTNLIRGLFLALAALFLVPTPSAAENVYQFEEWTVTSAGALNCADSPVRLAIIGKAKILDGHPRYAAMMRGLGAVMNQRCPGLREVVLKAGRIQQIARLPQSSAPAPARRATPPPQANPQPQANPRPQTRTRRPAPPAPAPAPAPTRTTRSAPSRPQPAAPVRQTLSSNRSARPNLTLAGEWIGIYQAYPAFIQLSLTVSQEPDASGVAPANIRVEGLDGARAPHMGVTPGAIRFNRDALSLEISATNGRTRVPQLARLRFHGVYDTRGRAFAGTLIGTRNNASPYFILVRKGEERRLLDRFKKLPSANQRARVTPLGQMRMGGSAPSEDRLRAWASQIYKEYPDADPYNTVVATVYTVGRNLFRDKYFTPYFGKPFDELSGGDMGKIHRRLSSMPAPRSNFPEERGNAAARTMAGGFWTSTAVLSASDMMLSVTALRSISAWRQQTMGRLSSLSPQAGAFQTLSAIEAEDQLVLGMYWPSEREAFRTSIDQARARLANPVLTDNVHQLVASSSAFSSISALQVALDALRRPRASSATRAAISRTLGRRSVPLANRRGAAPAPVREDIPSLAPLASESVRGDLAASVSQKIGAIVDTTAKSDAAAIAAFPASAAGLEAGGKWHAGMSRKYSNYGSAPAVKSLFTQFQQKRAQQFTAALPELRTIVGQTKTKQQVQATLSRYASAPIDRSLPSAKPLYDAAKARNAELDRLAAERARQAAAEKARRAREAAEAEERRWRRRKPAPTERITLGLDDMYPQPNATPIEQAISSVVAVLLPNGHGSAFLISKDGLAITNNHVVEGAKAMKARFVDGREYAARVWRTDPRNDFALIQIDCPTDCFTSYLSDEPLPSPGTEIFVIGTPRDPKFSNSVTKGIVSGLRRNGAKTDVQTDAAMNGGNSGGPMVVAETGRVVGVVTWKRRDAEGLGFAGSIHDALRTLGITLQ